MYVMEKDPEFPAHHLLPWRNWLAFLVTCLAVSFPGSVSGKVDVNDNCDGRELNSQMSCRAALPSVMRAIRVGRFGGPQVLNLKEDVPLPKPKRGEVLIRIHAAGVNPVETYIRSGTYHKTPELPYTPGHDGAGTVEELGEAVTQWKRGDRVFTFSCITGSYAQFATAPASALQPLPEQLSFEQGASLPTPYLTAYRALFHRGKAQPGETILIHGATGGCGVAAVQFARHHGLTVLATGGTTAGREMLRQQGLEHVFNHHTNDYPKQVMEATTGRGVDIIMENLANQNLDKDLGMLAVNGRVVVVGSRGRIEINPRDAMQREADIRGVMLFRATDAQFREAYAAIQAGIHSGYIKPVVGKRLPLENAPIAHEEIINGKGAIGKMVLSVSHSNFSASAQ